MFSNGLSQRSAEAKPIALTLVYLWSFLSLAFMSELHPVTLMILPLAALAFWQRERFPMTKLNAAVGVGICLLAAGLVSQGAQESGHLLGTGSLSFAVFAAGTLIVFTVLRSSEETRLAIPGLCGFLLVACTMTVKMTLAAGVGGLGVLLLSLALRERQGLLLSWRLVLPLLTVLALTAVLATAAKWSETRAAYLLNLFSMVPASGIRFPPSASLNSLQRWNSSDVVVLRVYGNSAPPYLVGRSFVTFDEKSFWAWKPTKEEIEPSSAVISPLDNESSLHLYPNDTTRQSERGKPVIIEFPDGGSGFTFYTPRYFAAIGTELSRLHRYSDGLWQVLARDSFSGFYCIYPYADGWAPPGPPAPLSAEERAKHLALPESLTPLVRQMAQQVAGAHSNPEEKAKRITSFFQTQFTYGYDYPFESTETALEEFLTKKPPAHCEFFATGAALMLRAQGVPTRYINGFVVQERSYDDAYYVIRLKHAHAWVEAYLPGQGWTVFDPTPPGVLENPESTPSGFSGALEWLSNSWRRLLAWFRLSPLDMFESAKRFITSRSPTEWISLAAVIALLLGVRWSVAWLRRRGSLRGVRDKVTPFVAGRHDRLTPVLETLQAAVQPPEWRRQNWETLRQWTDRLTGSNLSPQTLARIRTALERYAAARYSDRSEDTEIAAVETEVLELRGHFEGKSLEARERPPHQAP